MSVQRYFVYPHKEMDKSAVRRSNYTPIDERDDWDAVKKKIEVLPSVGQQAKALDIGQRVWKRTSCG